MYFQTFQIYPFIYVLMSNKTEAAYKHILQFIDSNPFKFNRVSFMTDYEKGMRNALKTVFPAAKMNACWFHYCQALRRNAAKKITNFLATMRNPKLNRMFAKFMVLP